MTKFEVGTNAGDIYGLLAQRGKLNLRKLGELTHKRESSMFLSLGWLLRENKIAVYQENGEFFFEIKEVYSEMYF